MVDARLFEDMPKIHPVRKLTGVAEALFAAQGDNFETTSVSSLEMTFEGISGDYHAGAMRKSGGREPWYPRGTEMRNERQLTILSNDELAQAASEMGIEKIEPQWIGGNICLGEVPNLSMLPASTLLFFEGGVTLKVDLQNAPCKFAAAVIAREVGREDDMDLILSFKDAAKRRRGLTAWVEKPGTIEAGEKVSLRLPEQWIYS